jgi:hypothetical protein
VLVTPRTPPQPSLTPQLGVLEVLQPARPNVHTAAPTNQELCGARAKPIGFDEQPIFGPDLDQPVRITDRAGVVRAAERTAAGAEPRVLGRLGQVQVQAEIAAMTVTAVFRQLLSPAPELS